MALLLRLFLLCSLLAPTPLLAQRRLAAGPMIGHTSMAECRLWVQTQYPATVVIRYRDSTLPGRSWETPAVRTDPHTAHTAILVADSVRPGRTYTYEVVIDGTVEVIPYPTVFRTQPVWKWQTTPPPSFRMALGSCFYVNEDGYERSTGGYGSDMDIVTSIARAKPDLMLWLGDNTYLREADWGSRSGILHRYAHTRALPQLQPLLAGAAHYAIWDDHDYGPNDADRSWVGKHHTFEAFSLFWPNPSSGVLDRRGITTSFDWIDVQFFLLDDRTYRAANDRRDGERTILGADQIEWLIDALAASKATFKVVAVGSQFLTDNLRKECFARMPAERQRIIDAITENKISGVLFLSGDIHASEFSKLERPGTYPLYEFTCSSLTAGSNKDIANQSNTYRVAGSTYGLHNFGLIDVEGPANARTLTLRIMDKDGVERWSTTLREQDLR